MYRRSQFVTPSGFQSSEEPQEAVEDRRRVRGAAGNVEIDGEGVRRGGWVVRAHQDRRTSPERAPADGAGADGNDEPGLRNGVVRFLKGQLHVFRDGAGQENPVRVPGRGDELNAEPAK